MIPMFIKVRERNKGEGIDLIHIEGDPVSGNVTDHDLINGEDWGEGD